MCTAATYKTKDFYFGRTLDYEFSYGDEVTVTPRNFCFRFRHMSEVKTHYAMIGMAYVADDYPLYYDAVNEKGLGMAGLNFVGNAKYQDVQAGRENVAQFEFIPWILCQCANVTEARTLIEKINITKTQFSPQMPSGQLHWIIADKNDCIVVESVKEGIKVYDDPVGVLTNNPTFDMQMFRLNDFRGLSPKQPENTFSDKLDLTSYSRGMGAMGLPGDLSSQSRFVRAAFVKMNSRSAPDEQSSVSQFFHILNSVDQQRGCCEVAEGKYEITIYTSCCNTDKGIYYYTTYNGHQISAVDMHKEDLDSAKLIAYPMITNEIINFQN